MDTLLSILIPIVTLLVGGAIGFFVRNLIMARRIHLARRDATKILEEASTKQKEILLEAKEEAIKIKAEVENEVRGRRSELHRQERRIAQKEENLDRKTEGIERRERNIGSKEKEIERSVAQLDEFKKKQVHQLELISGMSTSEAKTLLLATVEEEVRQDMAKRIREVEAQVKRNRSKKLARSLPSLFRDAPLMLSPGPRSQ